VDSYHWFLIIESGHAERATQKHIVAPWKSSQRRRSE
jgi:hypothetical protein